METPNLSKIQEKKEIVKNLELKNIEPISTIHAYNKRLKSLLEVVSRRKARTYFDGDSLLMYLILAIDKAKNEKKIQTDIPQGGSLLEIGGPSQQTGCDMLMTEVEKYVVSNPGFLDSDVQNSDIYMSDKRFRDKLTKFTDEDLGDCQIKTPTPIEYPASIDDTKEITKIVEKNNKFDYVTAYNVFGEEGRGEKFPYDKHFGADLTTAQKRELILSNLEKIIKPNGILAMATAQGFGRPANLGFLREELLAHYFYEIYNSSDQKNDKKLTATNNNQYVFQYRPGQKTG